MGSSQPFELPSFKVISSLSESSATFLVGDYIDLTAISIDPDPPPRGTKRIYFDSEVDRLVLIDENGLKFPIAYVGEIANNSISSLTAEANLAGTPSEEIVVTWILSPGSPPAQSYDVEYKPRTSSEFIRESTTLTSYMIDGLTPNTTYDIRVRAITDDVVGPYVTTSSFTLEASFIQESTIAFICLGDGATECAYGVVENGVEVRKILAGGTEIVLDISRNIIDGLATTPISQGEAIAFYNGFGTATAYDGPGNMYGMTSTADLSTRLFFTRDRNSPHEIFLYSLADCVATLNTGSGSTAGSVSLTSGSVSSISFSTLDGPFILTNDINAPLMGFVKSATTTPVDQSPIVKEGTNLIGIPSAEAWISALDGGSVVNITRSDNATGNFLLSETDYVPTGLGSGNKYIGASAVATYPVDGRGGSVTSVADSDGTKSTPWLRTDSLGTRGWILTPTNYIAIASENTGIVQLWNPGLDPSTDPPSSTLSLTQSPGAPCAKAYVGSGTVGSYIQSDVPIYVILEEEDSLDEYVMFTY
jgi:hypothetical protein